MLPKGNLQQNVQIEHEFTKVLFSIPGSIFAKGQIDTYFPLTSLCCIIVFFAGFVPNVPSHILRESKYWADVLSLVR